MLNIDHVRALLPGREIHWRETLDSTMYEAVRRASEGAPSGTVIGADEQTAGHGRHDRPWHSERGTGLYFSLVLRLGLDTAVLPVTTLALGCAAAEAIEISTGIACDLRWPNDVLVNARKCAGILTEYHHGAIVAGIGVNVNQTRFPADVVAIATSLRLASGHEHSRESLLIALLDGIERHAGILVRQGPPAILDLFTNASSYVLGRRVTVDLPEGPVTGTTAGLTESGFLKLRLDSGAEQIVIAGGVRPCS